MVMLLDDTAESVDEQTTSTTKRRTTRTASSTQQQQQPPPPLNRTSPHQRPTTARSGRVRTRPTEPSGPGEIGIDHRFPGVTLPPPLTTQLMEPGGRAVPAGDTPVQGRAPPVPPPAGSKQTSDNEGKETGKLSYLYHTA